MGHTYLSRLREGGVIKVFCFQTTVLPSENDTHVWADCTCPENPLGSAPEKRCSGFCQPTLIMGDGEDLL